MDWRTVPTYICYSIAGLLRICGLEDCSDVYPLCYSRVTEDHVDWRTILTYIRYSIAGLLRIGGLVSYSSDYPLNIAGLTVIRQKVI